MKGISYTPLSREEEYDLVLRGQAGDVDARNKVVMGVASMAWGAAYKHSGRNMDRANDMFDEIIAALCDKFSIFDPALGNRFSTWAGFWMFQVANRYRQRHGRLIRIPCHLQKPEELDTEDIRQQYIRRAATVSSLDAPVPGMDACPQAEDWKEKQPVDEVALQDKQAFVQLVTSKLSPRAQQIMKGRANDKTLEEIGVEMGVTRERVRQLEIRAIRQFLSHAEQINKPLMREIEQDICSSNRFQGTFQKVRKHMSAEQTKIKKEMLKDVMQGLGEGAKGRAIKEALAGQPFKVHDSDISLMRRQLWGRSAGRTRKAPVSRPAIAIAPAPCVASPRTDGQLEVLKAVNSFAKQFGGVARLHELTSFLLELSA